MPSLREPRAAGSAWGAPAALLDTQLLLWAAVAPQRLPPLLAEALANRDNVLAYSVASLWEVAIKSSLGRDDFSVDVAELRDWLLRESFVEWPVRASHVIAVAGLPWHHRDPFDRLLVAQAQTEGVPLISADEALLRYGAVKAR